MTIVHGFNTPTLFHISYKKFKNNSLTLLYIRRWIARISCCGGWNYLWPRSIVQRALRFPKKASRTRLV